MPSLISLKDALFRPIAHKAKHIPVFKKPVSLDIKPQENWAVIGNEKTTLLRILNNEFLCDPPVSRTFPLLSEKNILPLTGIGFLNFKQRLLPKVHLSARYEFFKEELDQTVYKFVTSQLVNSTKEKRDHGLINWVLERFFLTSLKDSWLMSLSNGQLRRARFAKAMLKKPVIFVVDDPFLGLDPKAADKISSALSDLGAIGTEAVILGLRSQDKIPDWITHIAIADGPDGVVMAGPKNDALLEAVQRIEESQERKGESEAESVALLVAKRIWKESPKPAKAPHIEFRDVSIQYKGKKILPNVSFSINFGEKWQIKGQNGSGKTTLLAVVTADHPQSWNSGIVVDGEPRKVGKLNYFDINKHIGISSPELHAVFPELNTIQAIATGFNDNVSGFITPKLSNEQKETIEFLVKSFPNIEKIKDVPFLQLLISDQKVVLFLRAIVKCPRLLILDEAFSCMDEEHIVICKKIVSKENWPGTILCIAHLENELPQCDKIFEIKSPGEYEIRDVSSL